MTVLKEIIRRHFGSFSVFAGVVALAAAAAWFLVSQRLQPCDDAYITFRHVKHLVERGAPAWNLEGQPVLGSSSPAFMFGLAAFAKLLSFLPVDQAALYFNAVLLFWIVIFSYLVVQDLVEKKFPALLAAALVGFNSFNLYIFSLGFEGAMLVLVLLASLYLLRKNHDVAALVLASLAPLVRPEGLILSPLVWVYLLRERRVRIKLIAVYLLIPLVWLIFSIGYYGSPIPQPIKTKKMLPSIYSPYRGGEVDLFARLPKLGSFIKALWKTEARSILFTGTYPSAKLSNQNHLFQGIGLLGALLMLALSLIPPREHLIYLLYAPLFFVLYAWIGHVQMWYYPSFITFSIILMFSGYICLGDRLPDWIQRLVPEPRLAQPQPKGMKSRRKQRAKPIPDHSVPLPKPQPRWLSRTVFGRSLHHAFLNGLAVLLFLIFWTANPYTMNLGAVVELDKGPFFPRDPRGVKWDGWERERYHWYREVAQFLNREQAQPGSVLISEIGIFGYFYQGKVIDSVGLCSPEVLRFYPPPADDIRAPSGKVYTKANNIVPLNMVLTLKPDFLVNSPGYIVNLFRPGSGFTREYSFWKKMGGVWGSPVYIFKKISRS